MHVGCAKAQLTLAGLEDNVFGAVELLELLRDLEGAVRGPVVNDDDLPIQLPIIGLMLALITCLHVRIDSYSSLKVLWINQMMIGRFLRSLKVGRIMEYLLVAPILKIRNTIKR
jgi:hypothetical protein